MKLQSAGTAICLLLDLIQLALGIFHDYRLAHVAAQAEPPAAEQTTVRPTAAIFLVSD
jgi:hypothetical protein